MTYTDKNRKLRMRCAAWEGMTALLAVLLVLAAIGSNTNRKAYDQMASSYKTQLAAAETDAAIWEQEAYHYRAVAERAQNEAEAVAAEYVGDFMVTAYCCEKYAHICGEGHGITKSGLPVQAGVTVAADPDVLPLGTVLYIEGVGIRIVQDTGGAIKGNKLDVALPTHEEALHFGQYGSHAVYIISTPEAAA